MSNGFDVVAVGGGHNGLTAAVRLAQEGLRVAIVEAREWLGGLAAGFEPWPEFRAPLGAYVLGLYPRRLMERLGVWDRVRLLRREPGMTVLLGGGRAVRIYGDSGRTAKELGRFSERDARAYLEWSRLWSVASPLLWELYSSPPFSLPEVIEALGRVRSLPLVGDRVLRLAEDLAWALTAPAGRLLSEFFESWEARAALAEDALVGELVSPWTPGTGIVLAHHYLGASTGRPGEWAHVVGGVQSLVDALAARLRELGGAIITGDPVVEVVARRGAAVGVRTSSGRLLEARRGVVLAVNIKLAPGLLGDVIPGRDARRIEALEARGASAKLLLATRGRPPTPRGAPGEVAADALRSSSVVMPGLDYAERALGDALHGGYSREPWLSVNVQTVLDPGLAPEGWHLTSVFAQYALGGQKWGPDEREGMEQAIREVMDEYFEVNWPESRALLLTPGDYEAVAGPGGHIFHVSMQPSQLYAWRPLPEASQHRLPWLEKLYLGSASAHPGGGVTGLPGLLAAEAILEDQGVIRRRRPDPLGAVLRALGLR